MLGLASALRADASLPDVLVVHSYHVGMPWADEVSAGLIESLSGAAEPVFTQLDVKRFPPSGAGEDRLAVAVSKAAMVSPRVIVTIDDYAFQLVVKHRERFGPSVPVVFGGVNYRPEPRPPGATGVIESIDFDETFDMIEALQPDARRWVVVNDLSETGLSIRQSLDQAFARRSTPEVIWLGSGTFAETESALTTLDPRRDAVLLLSWNLDAENQARSYRDAVDRARRLSAAPLYGMWSFYFGRGIVGGALLDDRAHGREIGELVKRVLRGEAADAIPIVDQRRSTRRADARELARFGLPASALPPGTQVDFAEKSLWAQHGATISAILIIFLLQSATITWLLLARRHRKQALTRLGQSEANLRLALDRLETAQQLARIGSWELDERREHVTISREMYRLLELEPGAGKPRHAEVLALFHPEDRPLIESSMDRVVATGTPVTLDVREDPARGSGLIFRVMIQRIHHEGAKASCLCGTLQDITAEARAEAIVRESRERMKLALEGADVSIWDWDIASGSVTFDEGCLERFGYRQEQLGSKPSYWAHLLHPDDFSQVLRTVEGYRAHTITEHEIEFRLRHSDGSWIRVLSKGRVIERSRAGKPLRAAGTHLDITQRHQREETLRSTERKLAEIFRSSPEVIALTTVSDGRFLEINDAFTRVLGFAHHEVVGHTSLEMNLWPRPEDRARVLELIRTCGAIRDQEISFRAKSGRLIPFQVSVAPINLEGEPCLIWLLTDITERKRAEQERTHLHEQLLHAMKLEAVGRLAGGVAHDFNNLLTVIGGNVELMRCDLDPSSPHAALLQDVATAAASAASLTRQLLAFSRRQIIEPKVLDLNELIENLRKFIARLIGEDVTLTLDLATNLGVVKVDPGQFEQVVINLAVNARDAMPKGGCLTIATSTNEIDTSASRDGLAPGKYVALTVSDTGHGIPPEVKKRLFEPFFTTKPVGRGTGLGLAMAFGVVKQAGGAIEVESEVDRGTTFRILLPCVDGPKESLVRAAHANNLPRGQETILIVEDDPAVRSVTSSLLRRLGYRIVVAGDGYDGVEKARGLGESLDLVLTDLVMPGMGGRELANQVRQIHPRAAVLFTSGYTEDAILRQGIAAEQVAFISKPYTMQAIATKVRETLDSVTASRRSR